jgi:hypothetical protein
MTQVLASRDDAEIVKALEDYGLSVELDEKLGEILILALVKHVNIDHGSLTLVQGDTEIEYDHYSRKLWIYNEKKGEPLEVRLPQKSKAGYHNGYLWILLS